MIKRPFIWVVCAYIAGMLLAWYHSLLILVWIIAALAYLVIYLLRYQVKKEYINRQNGFLWVLPLLVILGFYAMQGQMKPPELDMAFEREIECKLSGRITMIVEKNWGRALYVTDNTIHLYDDKAYLSENVIVYCSDQQDYRVGNHIIVYGNIEKFSEATNPGQFNEKLYYQIENIDYRMKADEVIITDDDYSNFHDILGKVKKKLIVVYQELLSDQEAGALIAMLLGEKYLLDDELNQLYRDNGISHILAISGLHISLLGMAVFQLLKRLRFPLAVATFLSILFIYCYGVLTNFSISTNRSIVMMTILLLSAIFGKTYDMLSATSLSALIILLQNPLQLFSAGFLLSFGAVLGIALLLPCFYQLFPSRNYLVSSLYVSISAQTITTPFLLSFFYQLPLYSVLINLLIVPATSVLVITAILAGIAGIVFRPLGVFAIGGVNYILKFYKEVCRIGSSLPSNLITLGKPNTYELILYLILILLFLWLVKRYQKRSTLILLLLANVIFFLPNQNPGLKVTMLDVGQGEAIYLESESRTTYLIDGGSSDIYQVGINRLQPFLLSSGVDHIDYAIITHSDSDHTSGLLELLQGNKIEIKNLIFPNIKAKDEGYMALEALAREQGTNIIYIKKGDMLQEGKLHITCLHPTPDYHATSTNDYSTVLSVTYGDFDMLLTGDLEEKGERLLIDTLQQYKSRESDANQEKKSPGMSNRIIFREPAVDYDILKVAHHGSRNTTSEELLRLIKPELSLISCGKNNRYGHPHAELLERINYVGSEVVITYESGAITIQTDGKRMVVTKGRGD